MSGKRRGRSAVALSFAIAAAVLGCGRRSCFAPDDRELSAAVALLVRGEEPAADEAERLLVGAGRDAIPILETGLYQADAAGRVRVVRALVRIGHPDALPILRYLARRDPAAEVRRAARRGLRAFGAAADAGSRPSPRTRHGPGAR